MALIKILVERFWKIQRHNTCLNIWPLLMFRLGKANSASLMLYVDAFNSTPSPKTSRTIGLGFKESVKPKIKRLGQCDQT